MNWLIGIWSVFVTGLFVTSFFTPDAATFEPLGRYLYMVMLLASLSGLLIAFALRLMRLQRSK